MKIRGVLWPDEWLAALGAGSDLFGVSKKTSNGVLKIAISLAAPFAFGCAVYYLIDRYVFSIADKLDADVLRAVMTVVAILAGFMITTILFTGRPNGLASLDSHELRDVRDKVSYLVLSQCLTLASHVACVLFCLVSISVFNGAACLPLWVGGVLAGFVMNSLVRASILPLQIWEVHAFALDVEISERIKAEKKLINGQQ
jgi:hypothetical protein